MPARTRHTLLERLKHWDDNDSWNDFFQTYWKLIYSTALTKGLEPRDAEDVVQETVIGVSKSLPNFQYDPKIGSFKSWLLKITYRKINDKLRERGPVGKRKFVGQTEIAEHPSNTLNPSEEFEETWDREWEKNLIGAAVEIVKGRVKPKDFQIFELGVLREWPVAKIREHLQVSTPKICLTKHRVSNQVKNELKRLQTKYKC